MFHQLRINMLTTDGTTPAIDVRQRSRMNIDIILGSSFAWGSAVVEVQWSNAVGTDTEGNTIEQWNSFDSALTLSSSQTFLQNESLHGVNWIRLKTTTADSGADGNAIVTMEVA